MGWGMEATRLALGRLSDDVVRKGHSGGIHDRSRDPAWPDPGRD